MAIRSISALIVVSAALISQCLAQAENPADSTLQGPAVQDSSAAVATDTASASDTSKPVGQLLLKVRTNPDGASLTIDEKDYGLTPAEVSDLDTGTHVLEFKKSGFYRRKATVRIESYGETELDFELTQPAELLVLSEPSQAQVSINGKPVGTAPYQFSKARPGEYVVTAALDGFTTAESRVKLNSGAQDTLTLKLEPNKAPSSPVAQDSISSKDQKVSLAPKGHWGIGIVLISFLLFTAVMVGIEKTSL